MLTLIKRKLERLYSYQASRFYQKKEYYEDQRKLFKVLKLLKVMSYHTDYLEYDNVVN